MAFDAGMLACALSEIKRLALGARIEKVYQPERDEIVLAMRSIEGGKRLSINAGSGNCRIGFTDVNKENPQNPPMFCMLLRKYLQGAKLSEVSQVSFDRVAFLGFDTRDEMGFPCRRYLIIELMGRYSNIIFADGDKKIITALRPSELSFDSKRGLVSGMVYEEPQKQDKLNPLTATEEDFYSLWQAAPTERSCDKFIVESFSGIAPVVAREIVYLSTSHTDTPLKYCFFDDIFKHFSSVIDRIKSENFAPSAIFEGERPGGFLVSFSGVIGDAKGDFAFWELAEVIEWRFIKNFGNL